MANSNTDRLTETHLAELMASLIDPSIIALNFESLDGEGAADALLYSPNIKRKNDGCVTAKYQHYQNLSSGWWCGGIDIDTGEAMEWGCFKPDEPRIDTHKNKLIKYEHPPAIPTEYFALRITFAIGLKIAEKYGLETDYIDRQGQYSSESEDIGFWHWAIEQTQVPLTLAEGAKKAACLLSIGYLSIGLPGIWGAHRNGKAEGLEPSLIPGLRSIVAGREILFVFDQDSNPDTARDVGRAVNTTAKDCRAAGAMTTGRISWDLVDHQYKGVDDLVAAEGAGVFDQLIDEFNDRKTKVEPEKEDKSTIAERVLKLAFAAEYFCTPDKATYADIKVDGVRETHSIRSRVFRLWLTGEFYDSEEKAINSNAMAEILGVLDAKAVRSKVVREVNLRTAEHQGKIYLDLGSADWSAIEIDTYGWRIIAEPPIRFTRPESLLALPKPIEGGSLDELKNLINVDGDSWVLIATFLLFCFCPNKTYPVLVLAAVRGSGKTAAAEILKGLIDPGKGGLIKLQNDIRNLAAAAVNRWLMVYDNVGYISPDQSDDLCRMATNFGFSTRTLHTTAEETTLEFTRPQIITAIDALVTRDDLADRVLMAQLGEITEDKRLAQGALSAKVEAARPKILGAMLTALSQTLAELPSTKPDRLPRMADYALFSIAAEKALGLEKGEFLEVFDRSRQQSRQIVLDASPLSDALMKMMEEYPLPKTYKGTASELLAKLEKCAEAGVAQTKSWPRSPITLNRQLDRLTPDLKEWGILISRSRTESGKFIHVQSTLKIASFRSSDTEPSQENGLRHDQNMTGILGGSIPVMENDRNHDRNDRNDRNKNQNEKRSLIETDSQPPLQLQNDQNDGNDGNFDPFPDKTEQIEKTVDFSEYLDEV
jgi:Domain of unknown function (DUF3854)